MRKPCIIVAIHRRRRRVPPHRRHAGRVVFSLMAVKRVPAQSGPKLWLPERVVLVAAANRAAAGGAPHLAGPGRVEPRAAVRVGVVGPATAIVGGVVVVIVVVVVVMVVHVDGGVGFLVVRGKREGGLVRVDVLAANLGAVISGQAVVPLVVFEGPDTEEGGGAEEEAVEDNMLVGGLWTQGCGKLARVWGLKGHRSIQDKHGQPDDGLAQVAGVAAEVSGVV